MEEYAEGGFQLPITRIPDEEFVELVIEAEAMEIRAKNTLAKRWAAILKIVRQSDISRAFYKQG